MFHVRVQGPRVLLLEWMTCLDKGNNSERRRRITNTTCRDTVRSKVMLHSQLRGSTPPSRKFAVTNSMTCHDKGSNSERERRSTNTTCRDTVRLKVMMLGGYGAKPHFQEVRGDKVWEALLLWQERNRQEGARYGQGWIEWGWLQRPVIELWKHDSKTTFYTQRGVKCWGCPLLKISHRRVSPGKTRNKRREAQDTELQPSIDEVPA